MRARLGVVLLALAVAACGSRGDGTAEPGIQPAPAEAVGVSVTNYNWADVTVYAVRNSIRHRLGTVTTSGTETFEIPRSILGGGNEVRLLLDPIGSRWPYLTDPILVNPGDRIQLRVENHLPLSSWMVR